MRKKYLKQLEQNSEKDPDKTEAATENITPEIDAVSGAILKKIGKAVEGADLAELETLVLGVADKVDENIAMKKLRDFWQHVPPIVRWAILHVPGTIPDPFIQTTRQLMFCGFLAYHKDPQINDEYLKHKDEYDKLILKWGLKIGKYFLPELAAVEKAMQPIMPIIDKQIYYRRMIREHLVKKHAAGTAETGAKSWTESGTDSSRAQITRGTKYISLETELTEADLPNPGKTYSGKPKAEPGPKTDAGKKITKYISEAE